MTKEELDNLSIHDQDHLVEQNDFERLIDFSKPMTVKKYPKLDIYPIKSISIGEEKDHVLVDHLEVKRGHRRKGYGKLIFAAIKQHYAPKKVILYLPTVVRWQFNKLRKIYNHMGFQEKTDDNGFIYFQI